MIEVDERPVSMTLVTVEEGYRIRSQIRVETKFTRECGVKTCGRDSPTFSSNLRGCSVSWKPSRIESQIPWHYMYVLVAYLRPTQVQDRRPSIDNPHKAYQDMSDNIRDSQHHILTVDISSAPRTPMVVVRCTGPAL